MVYEVKFKRLPSELSMDLVLRRPFSDEVEDYREYKRLRSIMRSNQEEAAKAKKEATTPALTVSTDGTVEVYEDETAEAPFQSRFTDMIPEDVYHQEMLRSAKWTDWTRNANWGAVAKKGAA